MVDIKKIGNLAVVVIALAMILASMFLPLGSLYDKKDNGSYYNVKKILIYINELYLTKACEKTSDETTNLYGETSSKYTINCKNLNELPASEPLSVLKALYGLTVVFVVFTGIMLLLLILGKNIIASYIQIFLLVLAIINLAFIIYLNNIWKYDFAVGGILGLVGYLVLIVGTFALNPITITLFNLMK